jgi:hypothetical protein
VGQLGTRSSEQANGYSGGEHQLSVAVRANQEPNERRLVDTKALTKCKAAAPLVARSAGTPSMARRLLVQRGVGVGVGNQRRINDHV